MRSDRGFTIIEVLISLALVAICIGMFTYFVQALQFMRVSQVQTAGMNYARKYTDIVKSLWQDQGYYTTVAMPSVAPPSGYTAKFTIDGTDCGNVIATSKCNATIANATNLQTVRTLKIDVSNGPSTISLVTQVAAPFYMVAK